MKISFKTLLCGALLVPLSFAVVGCSGGSSSSSASRTPQSFRPAASFDLTSIGGQVAEIVDISPDGNTLLYTDSSNGELGFLNISNLQNILEIARLDMNGEPTSVAITPDGRYAIVVVDGPNEARVIRLSDRATVRTFSLGGQPDAVAVSPDGSYALVAIENQRPDESVPLPVAPAGYLYRIRLSGTDVNSWVGSQIPLNLPGNLRFSSDPEPEFVDINEQNVAAVTLQENNAVAIVDLPSGSVSYFDAGTTTHAADLTDNGTISFTETLSNARREPDGIAWTPAGNLMTANEGDYDLDLGPGEFVGGRNFTIFGRSGGIVYDDPAQMEREVAAAGRYNDSRSDAKGVEPENVKIARFGARNFAFIALERANSLAVYRLDNESRPTFVQILPTGSRPEGIAINKRRNLIVTGNENDGTLSFFGPQ